MNESMRRDIYLFKYNLKKKSDKCEAVICKYEPKSVL